MSTLKYAWITQLVLKSKYKEKIDHTPTRDNSLAVLRKINTKETELDRKKDLFSVEWFIFDKSKQTTQLLLEQSLDYLLLNLF